MQYGGGGTGRGKIGVRPTLPGRQRHRGSPGIVYPHFRRRSGGPGHCDTIRRVYFAPVLPDINAITNTRTYSQSVSQWREYRDVRRANNHNHYNYHYTYGRNADSDISRPGDNRDNSLGW